MIAYRAEDISQRLVPHELYVREEFENSVQFDVSLIEVIIKNRNLWRIIYLVSD